MIKIKKGFTMAEMMVVMLVLTVLLAAAAPLMTKKKAMSTDTTWKYASNNSDIYYGIGDNQSAMIGQQSKAANDLNSRLIISNNDPKKKPFITFKNTNGTNYTNMFFDLSNFMISGPYNTTDQYKQTGTYNTAFGHRTLLENGSGYRNTAIGSFALNLNETGIENTAIGSSSMLHNKSGKYNTAVGSEALKGTSSAPYHSGNYNTAIGYQALYNNTTGSNNIAIGSGVLGNNSSGSSNIAIGNGACGNVTTGSNKVCIGNGSGPASDDGNSTSDTKIIYLGDADTTVYIPGNLVVGKVAALNTNTKYPTYIRFGIGNDVGAHHSEFATVGQCSNTTACAKYYDNPDGNVLPSIPYATPTIRYYETSYSDKRLKNVKGENKAGIEQIRQLRIFDYTFKKDPDKIKHVGVMAQDLEKVFPNSVTKGDDGYLRIRQEDMFYAVINAVKQLDKILEALIAEVKVDLAKIVKIDKQVTKLEKENKLLKEKNIELEKRIEKLEKAILEDDDDDDDDD